LQSIKVQEMMKLGGLLEAEVLLGIVVMGRWLKRSAFNL
jgi:hypothetical protein